MGAYAIFDETTNIVLKYRRTGDTNEAFKARSDVLIEPNVSSLYGIIPRKYWKHSNGTIVEMTQSEKNAVDANEALDLSNRRKLSAKKIINQNPVSPDGMALLALIDEQRKQINILRNEIELLKSDSSLPNLTFASIKNSAKAAIDAGDYD